MCALVAVGELAGRGCAVRVRAADARYTQAASARCDDHRGDAGARWPRLRPRASREERGRGSRRHRSDRRRGSSTTACEAMLFGALSLHPKNILIAFRQPAAGSAPCPQATTGPASSMPHGRAPHVRAHPRGARRCGPYACAASVPISTGSRGGPPSRLGTN